MPANSLSQWVNFFSSIVNAILFYFARLNKNILERKMKFVLSLILLTSVFAQTKGREIAEKANATQRNFGDESVSSTMYLISASNDTVTRHLKNYTIEREKQLDYSIVQFLNPPDVRGTGLLTYQNPAGDDKQWLYLPELRRVKKISSKNKSGAFMASEFSYEDITGNTLDKFDYTFLGEEELNGQLCYVVERVPNYKNSGYLKIKSWYSKADYLMQRNEYTDRKNTLLKVQTFHGWKKYGSSFRSDRIEMRNLQTGKKSIIQFSERKMNTGLKEKDFTKRSLQRIF
jgi:outer membrane lipoprotein-sorting protein